MNAKIISSALQAFFALSQLALPQPATAQGFAGLGARAEGFAVPQLQTVLRFPADHGAHPDFRIEWWYLTANLTGPEGTEYGLQWTLFRSALSPPQGADVTKPWYSPQLWMGHAAVTSPTAHYTAERFARGGIGQAGVTKTPFEAWIDDWSLQGATLKIARLQARGAEFSYDMQLRAQGPLVPHGWRGIQSNRPMVVPVIITLSRFTRLSAI
jgi:predicted secreted hydrolase